MKIYRIRPGIAALAYVLDPDEGREHACVYLSAEAGVVCGTAGDTPLEKSGLPAQVQERLKEHFAAVFAVPIEQRGDYMKSLRPFEVIVFTG